MEQLIGADLSSLFSEEAFERYEKIKKAKQFCQFLVDNGISYDFCIKHAEVGSCLESSGYYKRFEEYLGNDYIICKNLLLQERKGDKKKFLLITSSDKKVDLASVKDTLESRKLEFVQEDEMQRLIGTTPGNVSLFSIINDPAEQVNLVIDEELLDSQSLAFHPLYNGMSIFLPPKECFKFLSLVGREPIITSVPAKDADIGYQKLLTTNKK